MAVIRWEPARELQTIQQEMNRLFSSFFDADTSGDAAASPARRWIPPMDLAESGDHYELHVDLPGVSEQDVSVELQENVLTISGQRSRSSETSGEGYHRSERAMGTFTRSLTLPEGVDAAAIKAEFEGGVLAVTIPKPLAQAPRRVSISVGGQPAVVEQGGAEQNVAEGAAA